MRSGGRWNVAAFVLVLGPVLLRCLTQHSRLPWWELDPTSVSAPETTLTPATGFLLDALIWLGVACGVLGESRAGRRLGTRTFGLVIVGSIAVLLHGMWLAPFTSAEGLLRGDFRGFSIGSAWAAAMAGGWILAHLARDPAVRRAAFGAIFGVGVLLAARGIFQIMVEHPNLVRQFEADRARFAAEQGMQPDSAATRMLERRLRQPDATGWFALSNVYGSVMMGCAIALLGVCIAFVCSARTRAIRWSGPLLLVGAVLTVLVGVWLSRSKGAALAMFIGLFVAGLAAMLGRGTSARLRGWSLLGVLVPVGVLAIVVLRGQIGERIGELSLLFRWHYFVGSAHIIGEHPLVGVGPSAFKDAYLLHKPPLSPEEVESPHSVFFDWVATLGVLSAAWIAVLLTWASRAAGRLGGLSGRTPQETPSESPVDWSRVAFFTCLIAATVAMFVERAALTPDALLVRIIGLVLWLGTIRIIPRIGPEHERTLAIGGIAAALALVAHAQIELTPVLPGSAGWFMLAVGLFGAARRQSERDDSPLRTARPAASIAVVSIVLASVVGGWGAMRAFVWESHLHRAALAVQPVAEALTVLAELSLRPGSSSSEQARDAVLAQMPPGSIGTTARPPSLGEALLLLQVVCSESAVEHLAAAHRLIPSEPGPLVRASGLEMRVGSLALRAGQEDVARLWISRAVGRLEDAVLTQRPHSAQAWGRLAAAYALRAELFGGNRRDLDAALNAWTQASRLDPNGLLPAWERFSLLQRLGQTEAAVRQAESILMLDDALRLDPLRKLEPEKRRAVEEAAAAALDRGGREGRRTSGG